MLKTPTIAQQLKSIEIDFDTLHHNYHPMLMLVKELIGVIPNCDRLLEIWPTGFRSYNLLVPNCLNLPFSLFGFSPDKKLLGLGMYASSRTAQCSYCWAHTCSFALRRGVHPSSLADNRVPQEIAVMEVAEAVSQIPSTLTKQKCQTLVQYFSLGDLEWIILSIGLMGFLNKLMDALGVELEKETVAEVKTLLESTGWKAGKHTPADAQIPLSATSPPVDNLKTYLRVVQQVPAALYLEKKWTKGIPDRYAEAGAFLKKHTGHFFPLIGELKHKRAVKALTTVLRDNLDPRTSDLGLTAKCLAGLVYATVVGDSTLAHEARWLLAYFAPKMNQTSLINIVEFAQHGDLEASSEIKRTFLHLSTLPMLSEQIAAALILAKAASPSPVKINQHIVAHTYSYLTPASTIELLVWLSIQQLLHRLGCFYEVMNQL